MDSTKVPLGVVSAPNAKYLDPDNIVAYALASNDENPLYLAGDAVPPVFAVAVAWNAFMGVAAMPPEASAGSVGGVHGEHDLFLRKPMVPGTWLHTTSERTAVVCSKAGMNTFVKLVTVDDGGDVVIEQYWSTLLRGEVTGGDQGTPPPDHNVPDDARQRPVGTTSLPTTQDQTFRYAGASADRAPMHVDDEVARSMGFPRKFNQGLCSLAVTSRGLIELAAGGDPRRVRRIGVRFSSPVFPGNAIDLGVFDIGATEEGTHAYGFEASSEGQAVFRHGRVEVAD